MCRGASESCDQQQPEEIAKITAIDPTQLSSAVAHLLENPRRWFHVGPEEMGQRGSVEQQMEALEHEGEFFGLDVRMEAIAGQPGYYVYARVRCQ